VCDRAVRAASTSGCAWVTTAPPRSPPSGPRSTIPHRLRPSWADPRLLPCSQAVLERRHRGPEHQGKSHD